MSPKWSTGRWIKIKSDFKVWIQNGSLADSNGGLICPSHTNYEFPKKKISVHEITRARIGMCVCVLYSYVHMMYLIMCIFMYLLVYLCMMYVYSKYKCITYLLSHQYTFPAMCLLTPHVRVFACLCNGLCIFIYLCRYQYIYYAWALTRSPEITQILNIRNEII